MKFNSLPCIASTKQNLKTKQNLFHRHVLFQLPRKKVFVSRWLLYTEFIRGHHIYTSFLSGHDCGH